MHRRPQSRHRKGPCLQSEGRNKKAGRHLVLPELGLCVWGHADVCGLHMSARGHETVSPWQWQREGVGQSANVDVAFSSVHYNPDVVLLTLFPPSCVSSSADCGSHVSGMTWLFIFCCELNV